MNRPFAKALVDQLVAHGVTQFFLAPGMRCAPIALALENREVTVHFDERGCAFAALGWAKATGRPACVVTTSGTAVGNLLPAVMEAWHSGTPLILVTADRPNEVRGSGANQTGDQVKIFGDYVRGFFELPVMSGNALASNIAQAMLKANRGPVHINVPLAEPLLSGEGEITCKMTEVALPPLRQEIEQPDFQRGCVVLGSLRKSEAKWALELADRWGWPVVTDVLSNARGRGERDLPEVDGIVYFGGPIVSRQLIDWMASKRVVHVTNSFERCDPNSSFEKRIITDFCEVEDGPWALFLGNSTVVRDFDRLFFPETFEGEIFANRGLSGIDGNIATIAGIAHHRPTVGVIGDQTALHDLNSLALLNATPHPVRLIIVNNGGGQIFTRTKESIPEKHLDRFFVVSHTLDFKNAAAQFGLSYSTDLESDCSIIEVRNCESVCDHLCRHSLAGL